MAHSWVVRDTNAAASGEAAVSLMFTRNADGKITGAARKHFLADRARTLHAADLGADKILELLIGENTEHCAPPCERTVVEALVLKATETRESKSENEDEATRLVTLATEGEAEFFHSPSGSAYVTLLHDEARI